MRYKLFLLLFVLVTALSTHAAVAEDAIYQSNEARTGVVEKLDLPSQPAILWKYQTEPLGGVVPDLGGVLAAGSRLYVSDEEGRIFALRTSDGEVLWTQWVERGSCEAPLVMGDIAYFATSSGVFALSVQDGSIVWFFEIAMGANETSPLLAGDLLVVCGYDGVVYGLDAQTGAEVWTRNVVDDAPPSPPGFDATRARFGDKLARPKIAASDGKTLFQPLFDQSRLVAIDCKSGEVRWSFQAGGWIYGHPVVAGDLVYIGSQDKLFYALDKATGKVAWNFKTGGRIEAGAAVADGAVYFGSCDGNCYRLDAKTGKKVWAFSCDKDANGRLCPIYAAPLVAEGTVYLAGMEGQVYALLAGDGTLNWKLRVAPDSELAGNMSTDGSRLFLATRFGHTGDGGQQAVFAIGGQKTEGGRQKEP